MIKYFLYYLILLLRRTYRIQVLNPELIEKARSLSKHKNYVLALWHENLFPMILVHAHQDMSPLASLSYDGDIVSFILIKLGYDPVRGSSGKGWVGGTKSILKKLHEGKDVAITLDGPKGPRRIPKDGIFPILERTKTAVLPSSVSIKPLRILHRSWDHFKIPLPFATILIQYEEPYLIADSSLENSAQELTQKMNNAEKVVWKHLVKFY